jgi:type II secretory pathway predicted ATPase ExeA
MYEAYFGLRERPFGLTPDLRFVLVTPTHREALANLQYALTSRQGVTLLIGEAGTGKTTMLRRALASHAEQAGTLQHVHLSNPALTRSEFLEALANGFGLSEAAACSKTRLLRELEQTLRHRRELGSVSALIVDESQSLPDELLEEIRLLANIESDTEKLLPIVLAGQPELSERLNQWHLRQLKQRVTLRCALEPLMLQETAAYIAGRVRLAAGDPGRLFAREAIIAVFERSRGIPRTIGVLCDNALLTAFALDRPQVTADLIDQVSSDFDLQRAETPACSVAPDPATKLRAFDGGAPPSTTWAMARRISQHLRASR